MLEALFVVVLVLNGLWFGAGFRYFSIKSRAAAKILISRHDRESPLFETLAAAARFLGGMNLAFMMLAILALVFRENFSDPRQIAILCCVFGVAHASQFFFNLPMALKERNNEPAVWPVLSGPMLFIFTMDGVLMLANTFVAMTAILR